MRRDTPSFWTDAEIQTLDDFILREDGPEDPMDASMIDGFLCAILSGPRLIMPGEALRWIWDLEQGERGANFRSQKEAQKILDLIMRQWNAISSALNECPEAYEPLLGERVVEGKTYSIIDEWCIGYCKGVELCKPDWLPLTANPSTQGLLNHIILYGTEDGWDTLQKLAFTDEEHEAIADGLGDKARHIHAYWLSKRQEQQAQGKLPEPVFRQQPLRREAPKTGRNDPCHCGSGRKYKHCHGAN